jgi:hypothetical protein
MTVSKTGLLLEVAARANEDKGNRVSLSADFPEQNGFVQDRSRYISAQCSRRAGKSNGLALRFFKTMEEHPKSQSLYLSLTQDSAKSIMWPILQEIDERFSLGCKFTESKLEIQHPNGAKLKLMGADLKNFVKRLKGRKYPAVGIDEAQDMGSHLQSLIDDVLTPSIADYADGWLAITGTPGPVPQGYFFEVTQNGKFGYSHHSWDLTKNPHMPNPQAFIADLKSKREWTDDNPTLRREWLNQWVLDTNALWIKYSENLNHFDELPKEHKWNYVMGVDIGFKDADALAILAWSETSKETYLVEEFVESKQTISALIKQIDALQKKYNVYKIVMDEGGLGKKIGEDIRHRFQCPIEPADKAHKQNNVEFLNDALRLGRFKAPKDSRFAKDSYLVQIDWSKSTPKRIALKPGFHSDVIDAVLYAFRESYAFAHQDPPGKLYPGTKEWAEAQSSQMWEKELEGHMRDNEYSKWIKGEE